MKDVFDLTEFNNTEIIALLDLADDIKQNHEKYQSVEMIYGQQSIVFDQAESRLHVQKALLLKLLHTDVNST